MCLFFNVCFFNAGLLILVVSLSWAMGFCFWLWSVPFGLVCYVSFFGSVCLGFGGFGAVMVLVFWVLSSVFAAIFFLYFWGCWSVSFVQWLLHCFCCGFSGLVVLFSALVCLVAIYVMCQVCCSQCLFLSLAFIFGRLKLKVSYGSMMLTIRRSPDVVVL